MSRAPSSPVSPSGKELHLLRLGSFVRDLTAGERRKQGRWIGLAPLPLKVLAASAQNPGRLFAGEELSELVSDDQPRVDHDAGLNSCIAQIRAVLNDTSTSPRFTETVPRRGYRFIGRSKSRPTRPEVP